MDLQQSQLQKLKDWLKKTEEKIEGDGSVGVDMNSVKQLMIKHQV